MTKFEKKVPFWMNFCDGQVQFGTLAKSHVDYSHIFPKKGDNSLKKVQKVKK